MFKDSFITLSLMVIPLFHGVYRPYFHLTLLLRAEKKKKKSKQLKNYKNKPFQEFNWRNNINNAHHH